MLDYEKTPNSNEMRRAFRCDDSWQNYRNSRELCLIFYLPKQLSKSFRGVELELDVAVCEPLWLRFVERVHESL